ncbi:MAG: metallopeptidase TldD-related protein, partial [Pseudomonadota bacterium]
PRDVVRAGVLLGYVLDSYSARKLKLVTTGNAGGVHNLTLKPFDAGGGPPPMDLPGLLARMGTGLLVTEFIGFGVNTVTGDYSRGAAGFWVENGAIQYPVEEITVAGKLQDMFRGLAAAAGDVDTRGNLRTGSLLLEDLTIAGG